MKGHLLFLGGFDRVTWDGVKETGIKGSGSTERGEWIVVGWSARGQDSVRGFSERVTRGRTDDPGPRERVWDLDHRVGLESVPTERQPEYVSPTGPLREYRD